MAASHGSSSTSPLLRARSSRSRSSLTPNTCVKSISGSSPTDKPGSRSGGTGALRAERRLRGQRGRWVQLGVVRWRDRIDSPGADAIVEVPVADQAGQSVGLLGSVGALDL